MHIIYWHFPLTQHLHYWTLAIGTASWAFYRISPRNLEVRFCDVQREEYANEYSFHSRRDIPRSETFLLTLAHFLWTKGLGTSVTFSNLSDTDMFEFLYVKKCKLLTFSGSSSYNLDVFSLREKKNDCFWTLYGSPRVYMGHPW